MTTIQTIERCIRDCSKAIDNRGRWRPERACAAKLLSGGTTPTIAAATAQAAARFGEWLSQRKHPNGG
jgi:hypothetical protein